MNIRLARPDDLGQLTEIYNQAIRTGQKTADTPPLSAEDRLPWFREHQSDKYPLFVAEEDATILGYLTMPSLLFPPWGLKPFLPSSWIAMRAAGAFWNPGDSGSGDTFPA